MWFKFLFKIVPCTNIVMSTDALCSIFAYLLPKELLKCRLVCSNWKNIIERRMAEVWIMHCTRNYSDIYESAFKNSNGCQWYDLYRSLTLYSKLPQARETIYRIHTNLHEQESIERFQMLYGGRIGIQLRTKIIYYDINTQETVYNRIPVNINDVYRENMYTIAILKDDNQLNMIIKLITNIRFQDIHIILEVKQYLLVDKKVYCIKRDNYLHAYTQIDGMFTSNRITYISDDVLSLGSCHGYLYMLTYRLTIQMLDGDELKNVQVSNTMLEDLRKYNFLEQLDWRTFYYWWTFWKNIPSILSLSEIVTIRTYGHMLFVGYHWGVLHIYKSLGDDDFQEVMERNPLKVYCFMGHEPHSLCPVFQIDVAEARNGHNLIVAMPEMCIVINFAHVLNE